MLSRFRNFSSRGGNLRCLFFFQVFFKRWVWWGEPLIPVLGKQADLGEFETDIVYIGQLELHRDPVSTKQAYTKPQTFSVKVICHGGEADNVLCNLFSDAIWNFDFFVCMSFKMCFCASSTRTNIYH